MAPTKMDCAECRGLICGVIMGVYYQRGPEPRKYWLEFGSLRPPIYVVIALILVDVYRDIEPDRSFALAIQNVADERPPTPVSWKSARVRDSDAAITSVRIVVSCRVPSIAPQPRTAAQEARD